MTTTTSTTSTITMASTVLVVTIIRVIRNMICLFSYSLSGPGGASRRKLESKPTEEGQGLGCRKGSPGYFSEWFPSGKRAKRTKGHEGRNSFERGSRISVWEDNLLIAGIYHEPGKEGAPCNLNLNPRTPKP